MKITITYSYNPDTIPFCYWAHSCNLSGCGKSYSEAKERLIEKLKAREANKSIPANEVIEI